MRAGRTSALLVASGMLAVVTGAAPPSHAEDPDFSNGVSVLFAMSGNDVDVRRVESESQNRSYVVTIADPWERVTWFTDRPTRDAGTVSLTSFLRAWGPIGFQADPPNAVIEMTSDTQRDGVPAEIANPRVRADGSLVFRATLLEESQRLHDCSQVALFIDADDGSTEGSTWPMPKFRFVVDEQGG